MPCPGTFGRPAQWSSDRQSARCSVFVGEWLDSKTLQSTVRSEEAILFAWSAAQGAVPAKEQIAAI